jgi:phage terminase large subunit
MQVAPLYDSLLRSNKIAYSKVYTINSDRELLKRNVSNKKFIVCQGGGDAGKTVCILQYLCTISKAFSKQIILVAGVTMPNLKKGALRAYNRYVKDDFLHCIENYNKTDSIVNFKNGSEIHFKSYGTEEEARGAEWDYVFFNEANLFPYDIFWQTQRKTRKQVILDYNPVSRFWAHDKLVDGGETQFKGRVRYLQVDHRNNPFLTEEQHNDYESISDPDLFKVYSRGETGKLKGLIFSSTPCKEIPSDCTSIIWGLDYGYTNDPTAIVKIGVRGKERFLQECYYQPCADAAVIKEILVANGYKKGDLVFCEHDVSINNELAMQGISVIKANKKNKASNIFKVKQFNIYYTEDSLNYKKEVESYKYATATSGTTGEEVITNMPEDGNDHLIDAKVYAIFTHSFMFGL